jgi:hypothetical protein
MAPVENRTEGERMGRETASPTKSLRSSAGPASEYFRFHEIGAKHGRDEVYVFEAACVLSFLWRPMSYFSNEIVIMKCG